MKANGEAERPKATVAAGNTDRYPLSWEEQDLLFGQLPEFNRAMATFKVNTGMRDQEVCSLQWSWEVKVDALGATVFVVPGEFVKNREDRLVVFDSEARAVVEEMRGRNPLYVFAYQRPRGRKPEAYSRPQAAPRQIETMNNTAWQNARRQAAGKYREKLGRDAPWGFAHVRIHDLKHTFGRRLRAAGIPEETRAVLLGHETRSMPTHYSVAELAELLAAVNRIDRSLATLRSPCCALPREKVTQDSRDKEKGPGFEFPSP